MPEFVRQDGDTTLVSVSAVSIQYTEKVYDPLFLATSPTNAEPGVGLGTLYLPYNQLNIVGCVDQYMMCNPRFQSKCTAPSGIVDLTTSHLTLGLNDHQKATAFRIIAMLLNTDMYSNTYSTGDTALKATDKAYAQISTHLPSDQWIQEVKGWFEIGLAKMQSYAVQYAANTDESVAGDVSIPDYDSRLQKIFLQQCETQKIKSSGDLRNLSLDGIVIVAVIGGLITIFGLPFHPAILPLFRKAIRKLFPARVQGMPRGMTKHQIDYMVDGLFHLFFMAIENRDEPYEYEMHDDIPTFPENPILPPPDERTRPMWPSGQVRGKAIVYHYIDTPQMVNTPGNDHQPLDPGQTDQDQGQDIPLTTIAPPAASASQQALLPNPTLQAGPSVAASSQGSPGSSITVPDASTSAVIPSSALANATTSPTASNSNAYHVEQSDDQ